MSKNHRNYGQFQADMHKVVLRGGVMQELTAEAGKEVRIRRNDGEANEKLEQQENLLLKAKIAHARQLLQHNADHSLDLLR